MSKKKIVAICIIILVVSVGVTSLIFVTEPTAEKEGATKKTAMLVSTVPMNRGNYKPSINATGTVQPANDVLLSSRVAGEVIGMSENFIPGSFVKKGQLLLQIDPADFRNTLRLRESDLALAKANLRVEMGRQDVAQKDLELIGADLSPENKALVLREPQLESVRANIAAAEAAADQARLNLERTAIRAPFDAHILERNTNLGSQVAVGDNLGRLVGMKEYWVIANLPMSTLQFLSFPDENQKTGSMVKVFNESAWLPNQYREGSLYKLIGALNSTTRLTRIIVKVKDPLVRMSPTDSLPPLIIGSFVQAQIEAKEIKNVIKMNRDYLRKEDRVWTMEDGKLKINEVEIVFADAKYAYIRNGLKDGANVITSGLATVVEGAALRTSSK